MTVKPALSFLKTDSDVQLASDSRAIITAMRNNPAYPSPSPTLEALSAATNDFFSALDSASYGGRDRTLIKNQKRAALCALLRQLANYLAVACNGDLATLTSSRFPVQKPMRSPVGTLPAPATPKLNPGPRTGDLAASTAPVPNAALYSWRVALASAPEDYVMQRQTTAASIVFTGLTRGQDHLVEVNAIGTAGPSDWSGRATLMVV